MDIPTLPVIFRKHYFREGRRWEVTAFFPTLPSESGIWYNMTCYAHVGQHGSASTEFYHDGKKAGPAEYADLLAEVRQIYEEDDDCPTRLEVYQKMQSWMTEAREAAWRKTRATDLI